MNELEINVYFNDIERREELIELIKKTDGFDSCGSMSYIKYINRNIVEKKDHFVINIILQIYNIDAIKLLFKILKDNQLDVSYKDLYINLENEESIKQIIDLFQSIKDIQNSLTLLTKGE